MVAGACGVFGGDGGRGHAAVPLYTRFCRTTGSGGTPQCVASAGPAHVLDRKVKVRFDANISGGLPWRFEPETEFDRGQDRRGGDASTKVRQQIGARDRRYRLQTSRRPPWAAIFQDQLFLLQRTATKAGEMRDMTVVFFVDPELAKDSEQDGLDTITLSYTMYPVRQPETPRVESGATGAPGRS
jgi:cytochrome c oxidase assembly protein subunit 11